MNCREVGVVCLSAVEWYRRVILLACIPVGFPSGSHDQSGGLLSGSCDQSGGLPSGSCDQLLLG